jgi:hypothetical protein
MTIELPDVIERYQTAHDRRDTETALAVFTDDATVIDDGQTYVGADRIRSWLDNAASEFSYTRTLTGIDDADDGYVVYNHVAGDFPGGEVDLAYRFEITDGRISRLEILPS